MSRKFHNILNNNNNKAKIAFKTDNRSINIINYKTEKIKTYLPSILIVMVYNLYVVT